MSWQVDVVNDNQKILIVALEKNTVVHSFTKLLERNAADFFIVDKIPPIMDKFDYLFVFKNQQINFTNIKSGKKKTIKINGEFFDSLNFDRLLWFCFSQSKVETLNLYLPKKNKQHVLNGIKYPLLPLKKEKLLLFGIIITVFIYLFAFFPLILLANWYNYQALKYINEKNEIRYNIDLGKKYAQSGKFFYSSVEPIYLFFGLGIATNNLVSVTIDFNALLDYTAELQTLGKNIFLSIYEPNKSTNEINQISKQLNRLNDLIKKIDKKINFVAEKSPYLIKKNQKFQEKLKEINFLITALKKISPLLPQLMGKEKERRYLILFANNRELRPGGGFIGSFARVEFSQFTQTRFDVYDVYDADGQLKIHIEPPEAISRYLNQPHWFLRDSAFSVDFPTNCQQARVFLKKEMGFSDFDGCVLITTSAVEKIIEAFGEIYLADFKEKVNSNNFYLKAQLYSEKGFFPGSIQKKSFLNSVIKQIILNLDKASPSVLLSNIFNAFEEKQIVIYFEDENLQKMVDSFLWSGRLIIPTCLNHKENCINQLIFPFDANLGVNKADYFIERSIYLRTNIMKDGQINNLLTLIYKNSSPSSLFPGGVYKNYFQTYLPENSQIKSITKNGILIEDFEEKNEFQLKKIGFLVEIAPRQTAEIKISYQFKEKINSGKNIYQLVLQKQTGAGNKDFLWEINLASNIAPGNNNFSPLVKDGQIIYNTTVNTDKIFFIELNRI
jgi:hypothetical protein